MNQNERDALVDRYLAGQMNSGEESDFFLKVAVDPELQRTLKSFQVFDRVIERDREAVPSQGRYRGHVMAMLAATKVATGSGAAAGLVQAQTAATAGATANGVAVGLFGLKGVIAAVVGLGVLGGTIAVVVPSGNDRVSGVTSNPVREERTISDPPVIQAPSPQETVAGQPPSTATDVESPSARRQSSTTPVVPSDRKSISAPRELDQRHGRATRSNTVEKTPEFKRNDPVVLAPTTSNIKSMKFQVKGDDADAQKNK